MWLSAKVPRDAAFAAQVQEICDLYTRPLRPDEVVLCVDEMTSLQPRPRKSPTKAAKQGSTDPGRTRIRAVWGVEPVRGLRHPDGEGLWDDGLAKAAVGVHRVPGATRREIPASVTTIHIVLDNLRMHKGKQVQAWLAKHPRFVFHHPPVHCSWMNQVEQWFGIVRRKRLRIADFASKEHLAERLQAFIREWNEIAHPFNWTSKSVAKVMAKCQIEDAKLLAAAA